MEDSKRAEDVKIDFTIDDVSQAANLGQRPMLKDVSKRFQLSKRNHQEPQETPCSTI